MRRCALVVVVILIAGASAASLAHAAVPWTPCPDPGFQCATVPVPLDPTGAVPGTIKLTVERVVGTTNPTNTAIVALAGGPGQAAVPLADDLAETLKPGLAAQDLLVFDQRGTGTSGPLKCNALSLDAPDNSVTSLDNLEAKCANEIGPARGFYTTAQSVADIEALRVAAGYSKLILFGVSYGTKVAEEYAQTYPQNTAGLILDSVVPPTGPDALNRSTYAAIPRVLSDLCAQGACHSATPSVNADFDAVVKHSAIHEYSGTAIDGRGRPVHVNVGPQDLFGLILSGDLDPTLRAELPAALHGARKGDPAPLLRAVAQADGLNAIVGKQAGDEGEDEALFLDTTCEESLQPWPRTTTSPTQRRADAKAAIAALPSSTFRPFSRADALNSQSIALCLGWPTASPAPATLGPLPDVHTLVIEGQADTRTTVADAQSVAAQIPGSTLLVVPHTGHSVLGTDLSGGPDKLSCSEAALTAYFANQPPKQCSPTTPNPFSPVSIAPTSLTRVPGPSIELRTALAARETVIDELREFIGDSIEAGSAAATGSRVGGLRSGFSEIKGSSMILSDVVYVPGVTVSGSVSLTSLAGTLQISGSKAAPGSIHFSAGGTVTGTLDGHAVHAHPSSSARAILAAAATFRAMHGPLTRWPSAR